ncbi:sensor histidine kinase [Nitrospira sp. Kam-Ns4a]
MRLSLRSKETLAITLLTVIVVVTTSLLHVFHLTRVVVQDALHQSELIARQLYAQTGHALARAGPTDPRQALRRDADLRNLVEASVGYSPNLLYVLIADRTGTVILHSERDKEGSVAPDRARLDGLLDLNPARRVQALYEPGKIYEAALPLSLNGAPFGTIRLGVATGLLRRELNASLTQSLAIAGLTLPLAWLVAMGLANLALKPIRRLAEEMGRLRQGEFVFSKELLGADEVGELAVQLQLLGQELRSDRLKLMGSQAPLQQVVDQLEDGLLLCNPQRVVLFYNKAAEPIMGRPLEQSLGQSLEAMLPEAHPLRAMLDRAFALRASVRNATLALTTDAGPKEFLVSVFFVADAQRGMGAMVLFKDLDSIKTVQSLISYSAKLTALGRLTSGVAHEVKNPLNAMMIHLELLREQLGAAPDQVRQSLDVLASEIRRLDRVVQGFLKFIRPQELTIKPLAIEPLLQHLVTLLKAEWEKAGITFSFRTDPSLPAVPGDEALLQQAFLNILQNACQAMPDGGVVTLAVERDQADWVKVSIADTGVGIPAEDRDKIFTLYYSTKPDGSGIGLSLVYRIVQLHDGSIEVQSEVGRGTTIIVRLPLR